VLDEREHLLREVGLAVELAMFSRRRATVDKKISTWLS
jgi:hypothetical protein